MVGTKKSKKKISKKKISKKKISNHLRKYFDKSGKKYYTLDNFSRPFQVIINKEKVTIYTMDEDEDEDNNMKDKYTILVGKYKPKKIYIGKNIGDDGCGNNKKYIGNSILLNMKDNEYIYIGDMIYKFKLHKNDEFVKYYSQVGNNDVPYPFILGKKYIYLLVIREYIPREYFDNVNYNDIYPIYYESDDKIKKKSHNLNDFVFIKSGLY